MTIYNFNLGIGWASSGVEYAQAYRSNIFKKNNQNSKFIFMDLFHENLQPMTKNIGFDDKEIIWLYQFFTSTKISPTTFTLKDLEAKFPYEIRKKEVNENYVRYHFSEGGLLIAYLDQSQEEKVVYKTELINQGNLIQRDYYSYVKIFSEYFKPVNQEAYLYQRRFFNEDGSLAYEELLSGKENMYIFKDRTIYSKQELVLYFMERLNLTSNDILIIDRSTGIGPEILKGKGQAKVGVIVHAEHFNEPLTNDQKILWNNYYDYQFQNAKYIDFFVTATALQKEILEKQFIDYKKGDIRVFNIPVGSIDQLRRGYKRKKNGLITASRLASEKHLDWLIRAVVKARETIKDLSLDIYGRGGEEAMLRDLIRDLNAQDYIHLMGQQHLDDIYKKYTTYVSTSTSEGFGLTLLEAVGSGLGMIGFDVRYGSRTFIDDGENGYLVNYEKNNTSKNIEGISDAIIKLQSMNNNELQQVRTHSYAIAESFLTKDIQKKWLKLEKELLND
jgi:poly(glycerol-phosphate) alpha-glucosyltransferase